MSEIRLKGISTPLAVVAIIIALIIGVIAGYSVKPEVPIEVKTETITKTIKETETLKETIKETVKETIISTVTSTVLFTPTITPTIAEVYSLIITEVILDKVSEEGYNYYIMMLEAKYLGEKSWSFSPIYINLLSNAGYKYGSTHTLAERQIISSMDLGKGESTKGQISFKLPKNEKPAKLIYDDTLTGIKLEVTNIPEPTKEVSCIYFAEVDTQSKYSFISAFASIKTSGTYFYSGEIIKVDVEVSYSRWIDNPETIQIKSITVEGFEITKIDPKLPIELRDKEEVTISLELKVSQEGYKGNIKLTITA